MNMLTESEFPKIIGIVNHLGGALMEWLESLSEIVGAVGLPGTVIIMWAVMPVLLVGLMITFIMYNGKQNKQNNSAIAREIGNLASAIGFLSDKVQNPPMDVEESLEYFYLIMSDNITKKLTYLGDILRKNSINARKSQIQRNIDNEFKSIMTKAATKLSRKMSVCGDMGKILQDNTDWELFLNETYAAFFAVKDKASDDCDHFKIQDIKTIAYSNVDKIAKIIEENGVHNNS